MSQDHLLLVADHASRWMGIEVDQLDEGYALIRMVLREDMLNGFGMAHGGMIFAFADTCFALACNDPSGDNDTITVGAGADINFISSAREGQTLIAEGAVRAQTGRSGIYDIQVRADDVLVAEFRGRSRTIPNRHQNHAPKADTAPEVGPGAKITPGQGEMSSHPGTTAPSRTTGTSLTADPGTSTLTSTPGRAGTRP